jgi:dipeptidyl aminopeptidase/acylaminoacyl peptidase
VGGIDPASFSAPTLVRYAAPDGVSLRAFRYAPKAPAAAGQKRPVVVLWHGGPEAQSRPGFSALVQVLVQELHFEVLVPNVRGSDGYGKAFLMMDDGVRREASLQDIGATLDYIAAQPGLDASRVGVYGGSYGGYMVLSSLAFYPARVRAGVDVVGISRLTSFLESTQPYRRDLRRAEYGDERDPKVREVLERISPLNFVERITAALFVLQGKNDPRVPQSEAEQIVREVRAKGKDAWYLLALNEGHGFQKKENRDDATIAALFFLKEKL